MGKPVIVFVFEKKTGGVASMMFRIINNGGLRDYFHVRLVLIRSNDLDEKDELFEENIDADETIIFDFDKYANRYYELKRLHKYLGEEDGVIVCNDFLELDCIGLFNTPKKVCQIIHDFYSVKLFVRYNAAIDFYLTHSKFWKDVLYSADALEIKCEHIIHGIDIPDYSKKSVTGEKLKIAFTGRLTEAKGVHILHDIDKELQHRNISVEWVIIGNGPLREFLSKQWEGTSNAKFISPKNNKDVLNEMLQCDLFILPTQFEGYGSAILEALACGLVPIVADVAGGTREILKDIGHRVEARNPVVYADYVEHFNVNRNLLATEQVNCREYAEHNYDIKNTAKEYTNSFIRHSKIQRRKYLEGNMQFGSFLDKAVIPDVLVKVIRRIIRK
ncbi:MAG: glycosyltransferase [Bacteroidetes bacterium]|nr:glycosyltransferase [Bacteroidota bacterium]